MIDKTVKIRYMGFTGQFDPQNATISRILKKHFKEVIICDDADYIILSVYGDYNFLNYPQVRIMYSGENLVPDFNLVDYAYSSYPISFLDRHFHFPQGFHRHTKNEYLQKRSVGEMQFDRNWLSSKTVFANFCASHDSENGLRGSFFRKLCEYKKVDSIGSYLNNTNVQVNWKDNSKYEYQKKCKFTLCFESTAHGGFNTEKIVDAFCADTIPVYYGDPHISDIYNPKAFVNVANFPSMEAAIQKIIEIDQKDDLYLEMMNEPVLLDPQFPSQVIADFEDWIVHIFEQPVEQAYRRSRVFFGKAYETVVKMGTEKRKKSFYRMLDLQRMKEKIFGSMKKTKIGTRFLDWHQARKMSK